MEPRKFKGQCILLWQNSKHKNILEKNRRKHFVNEEHGYLFENNFSFNAYLHCHDPN